MKKQTFDHPAKTLSFLIFLVLALTISSNGQNLNNALPSSGNVGLGTNNPLAKLHVIGHVKIDSSLVISDSVRIKGTLKIGTNSLILRDEGGEAEIFTSEAGEPLHIQSSTVDNDIIMLSGNEGRIGIGTITPQNKVHVVGDMKVSGPLFLENVQAQVDPCAQILMLSSDGSVVTESTLGSIADPCASPSYSPLWHVNGNKVGNNNRFLGTIDNYDLNFRTNNLQRIIVKATGETGIGTATPEAGLRLQIGEDRPLTFSSAGGQAVFGEYIGFNAYLNTSSAPGQFVKMASPDGGQTGGAAIITDYTGDLMIQTFDAPGTPNSQATTALRPQFIFESTGAFRVKNQAGTGNLFSVIPTDDKVSLRGALEVINPADGMLLLKMDPASKVTYARGIKVTMNNFPDYVFETGYVLRSLSEVEAFVNEYKHLPGFPDAAQVEAEGMDVGEMNRLLVEKVEELTLYVIALKKELDDLK